MSENELTSDYKRSIRAVLDVESVERIGDKDSWIVSTENSRYLVDKFDFSWECGCPDWDYRGVECKHIRAVQIRRGDRMRPLIATEVDSEPQYRVVMKMPESEKEWKHDSLSSAQQQYKELKREGITLREEREAGSECYEVVVAEIDWTHVRNTEQYIKYSYADSSEIEGELYIEEIPENGGEKDE